MSSSPSPIRFTALLVLAACADPGEAPLADDFGSWQQVWSDEFDGAADSAPDPQTWAHDVGGDGWGNNQLEYDTDSTNNVRLDGEGNLEIVARQEDFEGNSYTSGRIRTLGLFEQGYGRFEVRAKLPEGQGLWPAFWMLGTDYESVGWPECGEIDVMEFRGDETYVSYGTVHGPGYSGGDAIGAEYTLPDGAFTDDFHTFAVEVDPEHIAWTVDDVLYQRLTPADLPDGGRWVFDKEYFLILNLAVGGWFAGDPDADTVFPATMTVDYVRVSERVQ
jgi:beta-glucanase (GH16 family)